MKSIPLMFFIFVTPVYANSCWNSSSGGTKSDYINLGSIVTQRDTPVGTVIATQNLGPAVNDTINCDYSGNYLLTRKMIYNGGVLLSNNIFKTNVQGVGIRLRDDGGIYTNPPSTIPIYQVAGLSSYSVTVELVKMEDIISGTLSTGKVGEYYITENGITLGTMTTVIMNGGNTITQLACSVSTKTLNFAMDNIQLNSFGNTPGFSPSKTVTQDLGLNCDANANVNITLAGNQNPDVSDNSVLALSNQGQNGVAEGVGVQFLYEGKPLKINELLNLKKSAGGQESFAITARYYQTKNQVKPGSANATATLNLIYQ
ncbi:Fimbria adhesin protein precursor [compost metagenome]